MKGYPDAPRCGFSALAVKVLQQYGILYLGINCQLIVSLKSVNHILSTAGVSISARDILTNMKLKESVKAHT
jgi:glutaredoxin-related protein